MVETYLLTYTTLMFGKITSSRRVLNFNREIESLDDVLNIEEFLKDKMNYIDDLKLDAFSPLKVKVDDLVYDLDEMVNKLNNYIEGGN